MKESVSILIVDDEPEARDLLALLLARISDVRLAGSADNVDRAMEMVQELDPDLILLDIQMPVKSGFELVRRLHDRGTDQGYIFVTAFDEYAIEAIRSSAFDYLLKPVDPDELEGAISRFRSIREQKILSERIDQLLGSLGVNPKLKLNTRSGFIVIDPGEILCCIADGNYTRIVMATDREEMISSNLGTVERLLQGNGFFRISRSALINFQYLTHVDNRKGTCRLEGNSVMELKVARNRLGKLGNQY